MFDEKRIKLFWEKVDKGPHPNGCWLWIAHIDRAEYGRFWIGKDIGAHRVSYALAHDGKIPELDVLHRCDNPSCVNPDHLFLGTHTDNMRDMYAKGRRDSARGERHGMARLTAVQVTEMRSLYATGRYSQSELARMFGIAHTQAHDIIKRKSWKHVL